MQYLSFCDGLMSLAAMPSKSIHVVACARTFSQACMVPIYHISSFIYLSPLTKFTICAIGCSPHPTEVLGGVGGLVRVQSRIRLCFKEQLILTQYPQANKDFPRGRATGQSACRGYEPAGKPGVAQGARHAAEPGARGFCWQPGAG